MHYTRACSVLGNPGVDNRNGTGRNWVLSHLLTKLLGSSRDSPPQEEVPVSGKERCVMTEILNGCVGTS